MRLFTLIALFVSSHAFAQGAASRDPSPADDASRGYVVGSTWTRTDTGATFTAQSVATGAAVWSDPRYPATIGPILPVVAFGTRRLTPTYTGLAIQLDGTTDIGFAGDVVDAAAIDAHAPISAVSRIYPQIGAVGATQSDLSQAPKIGPLPIGAARTVVFEGGSQSGAVFGMQFDAAVSSLGLSTHDYTIVVVKQSSMSLARNQALPLGPTKGTLISLETSTNFPVIRVAQDSATPGQEGWRTGDYPFSYLASNILVPTSPTVLEITSGGGITRICENEQCNTSPTVSSSTNAIVQGFLGRKGSSGPGGTGETWDGMIEAVLIYPQAISTTQRAALLASLTRVSGIAPQGAINTIFFAGDSIMAGYTTLGIYGPDKRVAALLNQPARFVNMSIAGSTASSQGAVAPPYAYLDGLMDTSIARWGHASPGKNALWIATGGNDPVINPNPPTPQAIFAAIQSIVAKARTAGFDPIIVQTLFQRDRYWNPQILAVDDLIRAGAGPSSYILADVFTDPTLAQVPSGYPGPMWHDQTHPAAGIHQEWATFMAPIINAEMGW